LSRLHTPTSARKGVMRAELFPDRIALMASRDTA
jgi:hypothetical protein